MMKVRLLKPCSISGMPAKAGDIREVNDPRAKALVDNQYAEPLTKEADAAPASATTNPKTSKNSKVDEKSADPTTAADPAQETATPAAEDPKPKA